ncbi:MAG TPA: GNAT family N-acetyltransferase [Gaiellaceae bacterium]|nr:GNAT family N-acetyltransferase [Gaiellaceae bacterium]
MNLSVDVVTSLDAVADEWDELAADRSLYLDRRWLRSLERDPALEARYVLVRAGWLLGALPAYVWDGGEGWATGAYDVSWSLRRAVVGVARAEAYPAVLAGSRAGYANEPLLAPGLSEELRQEVAAALLQGVDELAEEAGASVVEFPFLTRRGLLELAPAIDRFGPRLLHSAGTRLEVRWDSFDGYLRSLGTQRRHRTRAELRRFEASGLTTERRRLGECYEELAPLSANVQRRYGHADSPATTRAQLRAQAAEVDEESVVFLARRDGRAVGFSLAYEHAGALVIRTVGFDYEHVGGGDAAYFNLGFYLPIRFAAEAGLSAIECGPASYRAKVYRGCEPYPLFSVVRPTPAHRGALARWAPRWNESAFGWWEGQLADFGPLDRRAWVPETVLDEEEVAV